MLTKCTNADNIMTINEVCHVDNIMTINEVNPYPVNSQRAFISP